MKDESLDGFKYPPNSNQSDEAIAGAFEIVRTLHKECWSVVEKVLNVYLDQVAKGRGWEWD